jgi:hypothetical protein
VAWAAALALLLASSAGCRSREAVAQAGRSAPAEQVAPTPAGEGARVGAGSGAAATRPVDVEPPVTLPATWKPMPEVVRAIEEALAAAEINGAKVAAWGDAGRGCYAIQLAAREQGSAVAKVEAGLRKGFGAPPAEPSAAGAATESAAPGSASAATGSAAADGAPTAANAGSAELSLALSQPLPGMLRARLRDDGEATRLAAAVCFFHDRYPEQCRRHCERALASLEAP